mgnify:CR=1 FL=1
MENPIRKTLIKFQLDPATIGCGYCPHQGSLHLFLESFVAISIGLPCSEEYYAAC